MPAYRAARASRSAARGRRASRCRDVHGRMSRLVFSGSGGFESQTKPIECFGVIQLFRRFHRVLEELIERRACHLAGQCLELFPCKTTFSRKALEMRAASGRSSDLAPSVIRRMRASSSQPTTAPFV